MLLLVIIVIKYGYSVRLWFCICLAKSSWFLTAKAIFENISCKYFEPTQITRGSLVSWDFAYFRIWKYSHAKSFWRREELWRAATGGRPVYNKAQYPRISLSCIFNDFLGDFGRSSWWCEGRNREVGHKRGCTPREQRKIGIVKMNRAHIYWCLK